ncbi:MAG: hypothetical protein ACYDAJ_04020 [Nitrosotalea sp.]
MKTLHLSIIVGIVLAMTVNTSVLSYEQTSPSGSVLFMKSNSTAQLTVEYTFHSLQSGTQNVGIEIYNSTLSDPNPLKLQGLTITAEPNTIYTNTTSTNVTYTITSSNNLKGIYAYLLGSCGFSPLVIGQNESEADSLTLLKFFTAVYHCGVITDYTPEIKIINYTNIISKTITIDPSHFSPLKQMKSIGYPWNVVCKQGFQLIAKKENLSPACVNPLHITRFLAQGWTLQNTG